MPCLAQTRCVAAKLISSYRPNVVYAVDEVFWIALEQAPEVVAVYDKKKGGIA